MKRIFLTDFMELGMTIKADTHCRNLDQPHKTKDIAYYPVNHVFTQ